MTDPERITLKDPIISKFLEEMERFSSKNPEEGQALRGSLMLWCSSVLAPGETGAEGIKSQILAIAINQSTPKKIVTAGEVIEAIFSPNPAGDIDADIIMGRFQLWS